MAQEEAQQRQQTEITPEHLLMGLMREREGAAARALSNCFLNPDHIITELEPMLEETPKAEGEPGMTPASKLAVELAVNKAEDLNHTYIGTEHLLLGIVAAKDSPAARLLADTGAYEDTVRKEIDAILNQPRSTGKRPGLQEAKELAQQALTALDQTGEDPPGP